MRLQEEVTTLCLEGGAKLGPVEVQAWEGGSAAEAWLGAGAGDLGSAAPPSSLASSQGLVPSAHVLTCSRGARPGSEWSLTAPEMAGAACHMGASQMRLERGPGCAGLQHQPAAGVLPGLSAGES